MAVSSVAFRDSATSSLEGSYAILEEVAPCGAIDCELAAVHPTGCSDVLLRLPCCAALWRLSARGFHLRPGTWYRAPVGITELGSVWWREGKVTPAVNLPALRPTRVAGEKGRIIGRKRPLLPRHVWSIRARVEMAGNARDFELFNMAVDSKLRGCDLVAIGVRDVYIAGRVKERTSIKYEQGGQACPVRDT